MDKKTNMKYLSIFTLIISLYACNENNRLNNNSNNQAENTIQFTTADLRIVGRWSMCAESGDGEVFQYNACPTVIFNSDGSGSIIRTNRTLETFSWNLADKSLNIYYSKASGNEMFSDTNYMAILKQDKSGIKLEIRQPKEDHTLYLEREL
jgi:hypothetical protein